MLIKFGYTYNIWNNAHTVLEHCNFKYDPNNEHFMCKEISMDDILRFKKIKGVNGNAAPDHFFVEDTTLFLGRSNYNSKLVELMTNVE